MLTLEKSPTTQAEKPAHDLPFLTLIPRVECPACESVIPSECRVHSPAKFAQVSTRTLTATCPHCQRTWRADCVLMADEWRPVEPPRDVTDELDAAEADALASRRAKARGEIDLLPPDGASYIYPIEHLPKGTHRPDGRINRTYRAVRVDGHRMAYVEESARRASGGRPQPRRLRRRLRDQLGRARQRCPEPRDDAAPRHVRV